jgi:hypothetical protein
MALFLSLPVETSLIPSKGIVGDRWRVGDDPPQVQALTVLEVEITNSLF